MDSFSILFNAQNEDETRTEILHPRQVQLQGNESALDLLTAFEIPFAIITNFIVDRKVKAKNDANEK